MTISFHVGSLLWVLKGMFWDWDYSLACRPLTLHGADPRFIPASWMPGLTLEPISEYSKYGPQIKRIFIWIPPSWYDLCYYFIYVYICLIYLPAPGSLGLLIESLSGDFFLGDFERPLLGSLSKKEHGDREHILHSTSLQKLRSLSVTWLHNTPGASVFISS